MRNTKHKKKATTHREKQNKQTKQKNRPKSSIWKQEKKQKNSNGVKCTKRKCIIICYSTTKPAFAESAGRGRESRTKEWGGMEETNLFPFSARKTKTKVKKTQPAS